MPFKDEAIAQRYEARENAKAILAGKPLPFAPPKPSPFNAIANRAQALVATASLRQRYGEKPVGGIDELAEFQEAMALVLVPADTCVLTAWLGGARKEGTGLGGSALLIAGDVSNRQTAREACGGVLLAPAVDPALGRLAGEVPPLAELVRRKGEANQAKQDANEQRNVDEDSASVDLIVVAVAALVVIAAVAVLRR